MLSVKLTKSCLGESAAVLWAILLSNGDGSKQKGTHLQLQTDFLTEGWHFISRCDESNTGSVSVGFVPENER
jgi:hypothetical protein